MQHSSGKCVHCYSQLLLSADNSRAHAPLPIALVASGTSASILLLRNVSMHVTVSGDLTAAAMLNVHELCAAAGVCSTVHAAAIAKLQQCVARSSLTVKVQFSLAGKLCTMSIDHRCEQLQPVIA
jgi:hypothetical protein